MAEIELNEFMEEMQKNTVPYTPQVGEKLLKVSEYAKIINKTAACVRLMLKNGELSGIKVGKQWRVKYTDPTVGTNNEIINNLRAENSALRMQIESIKAILQLKN